MPRWRTRTSADTSNGARGTESSRVGPMCPHITLCLGLLFRCQLRAAVLRANLPFLPSPLLVSALLLVEQPRSMLRRLGDGDDSGQRRATEQRGPATSPRDAKRAEFLHGGGKLRRRRNVET